MSGHIKNIQLACDNRFNPFPKTRKIQGNKSFIRQLNVLKIFTRLAKNNSLSQKETNESKQKQIQKLEQRFLVVSKFNNLTSQIQSLSKNFKLNRQRFKTYTNLVNSKQKSQKTIFPFENEFQKSIKSSEKIRQFSIVLDDKKSQETLKKIYISNENMATSFLNGAIPKKQLTKHLKNYSKTQNSLRKVRTSPLLKQALNLRKIKSESYIIVEFPSQKTILSHRHNFSVQIASLTKIMTFRTIMQIASFQSIDVKSSIVTISSNVGHTTGTVAQIMEGEVYTVEQLLYGLMLPSGNDAANELAYWGGASLVGAHGYNKCRRIFVDEMNRQARILRLKNTQFGNPHGLPHQGAKSTAADLAKLCCQCMKDSLFRKIVSCRNYKLAVNGSNRPRLLQWNNTNKLLKRQGFIGLKTGITVTAGPCLASAYTFRDKIYIVVVLRAPKISHRFKQTRILLSHVLQKLHKDLSNQQLTRLKTLIDQDSEESQEQEKFEYSNKGFAQHQKRCNILEYDL